MSTPESKQERKRRYDREWRRRKRAANGWEEERARSERNRALILKAKDQPCVDCGCQLPPERMCFDHVRGEKLFNVSRGWGRSVVVLEAEIAKCDVRCRDCHERRHGRRKREERELVIW